METSKKNFIIWFRAKSKGCVNINKMNNFTVIAMDEFGKKETIEISPSNAFKVTQAPTRFEVWFNVENALSKGFYPTDFKFENFKIPVQNNNGNLEKIEIEIFRVKSDGEKYHNLLAI